MCFVWIWKQTAIISLYSINWLVFITETECVYCAVRTGSLYTASLTFSNSTFCPHRVFTCFVWIWEQTAIIPLYNINWLVCITDGVCLLRGTDWIFIYTHIIQMNYFMECEICTLRAVHCSQHQVSRQQSAIRSATRQWVQRILSDGSDWFIKTEQSWRLWLTGTDNPSRTPESIFNLQPALRSNTDGIPQQYKQPGTQKASKAWVYLNTTQTLCGCTQYTQLLSDIQSTKSVNLVGRSQNLTELRVICTTAGE